VEENNVAKLARAPARTEALPPTTTAVDLLDAAIVEHIDDYTLDVPAGDEYFLKLFYTLFGTTPAPDATITPV